MITIEFDLCDLGGMMEQLANHASIEKCTITFIAGKPPVLRITGPRNHVKRLFDFITTDDDDAKLSDFIVAS